MAEIGISVVGFAGSINEASQLAAKEVGDIIARRGLNLVCGGMGGVMAASCEGFKQVEGAPGKTIGYLPFYDFADANPWVDIVLPTGLDIGRNQLVVAAGRALVAIGGGAGTLSEIALAGQLGKPIGLVTWCGGWSAQLEEGFIDHRKKSYLKLLNSTKEVEVFINDCLSYQPKVESINAWHDR
ncbi:LOG family protein [Marinobacter sp. HL-58]|uniref:SLOG cluster 4 domain-containing protein n=1 Tax=Marinobacter sp. HL-58 TaxID=1479237 RepID=UPI00068E9A2D|nr:LOG family protein [Marinobacter sp. HL-58]KPQ01669.1 MAG: putative Rossmann fold nucleotide-binding protein [Marinobacter sp. HL-58]